MTATAKDTGPDAIEDTAGARPSDTPADAMEFSLRIAAPPARVFRLLTDPDGIGLWFSQVAGVEPRIGGIAEFVFFNDNGTVSVFSGEVTDFDANTRFGFTWRYADWTFPPLHVRITLAGTGGETTLRLRQTGFAAAPPQERDVHAEGWARYLDRLAAVADGTRPQGWYG